MGKRLQRISRNDIADKKSELVNIELNIVLIDGTTFHGEITKWSTTECYFKDFRNHIQHISISDIAEIITDKISSY